MRASTKFAIIVAVICWSFYNPDIPVMMNVQCVVMRLFETGQSAFGHRLLTVTDTEHLDSLTVIRGLIEQMMKSNENVAVGTLDLQIPTRSGEVAAQAFFPKTSSYSSPPIIVYYHAGGWVVGSVGASAAVASRLADRLGGIVISVEYRLAPEHKFPAAAHDAIDALKWVLAQAKDLAGPDAQVGVAGDSSGGNLATVATMVARDEQLGHVAVQALVYPVTCMGFGGDSFVQQTFPGAFLTTQTMLWFTNRYTNTHKDLANPLLNPCFGTLENLPPAVVLTAGHDVLLDQDLYYAKQLTEAGVRVEHLHYKDAQHGFFGSPFPHGEEAVEDVAKAMKKFLAGGTTEATLVDWEAMSSAWAASKAASVRSFATFVRPEKWRQTSD